MLQTSGQLNSETEATINEPKITVDHFNDSVIDKTSGKISLKARKAAAEVDAAGKHEPQLRENGIPEEVLEKLLPGDDVITLAEPTVAGGIGYRFIKRTFDVCSTGLALIVLAIPMAAIAVKIKSESPGPAIYAQERVGKDEKYFKVYKFRSMYIDAEARGARWAAGDDPRVTPFGKFMRKTRLASVIIGTPGDGESTKSLSRSANSSLDLQLCECRPGLCSTCNSHYKPFEFLSLGIFGGVPSLSRNLVGCNGFSPSEESAIRFSFLGFGKDGACAAW